MTDIVPIAKQLGFDPTRMGAAILELERWGVPAEEAKEYFQRIAAWAQESDLFGDSAVTAEQEPKPRTRPGSYLSPPDFHRLNWACRPITEAYGEPPYLVGSALTRPDFRDIDIRLILDDESVERMFNVSGIHGAGDGGAVRLLFNIALSDLITKAANPPAPIDFQIQSMTEANVPEHGIRCPMGVRRTPVIGRQGVEA